MGEYHWRSFKEVDRRTNLVASGLSSLGLKVQKAIKDGVHVETVIYFESPDPESSQKYEDENAQIISFTQLLNMGKPDPVPTRCSPQDLAVIMYTSGTTGNPKGVMIAHENVVAASAGQGDVIPIREDDTYIGYLPLAHILEVCGELVTLTKVLLFHLGRITSTSLIVQIQGVRVGYSSAQTLFDRAPKIKKGCRGDCYALKPTLMACVPAIMDRIYKAVIDEVNSNTPLFREMFKACYERKRARYEEGYSSFILNKKFVESATFFLRFMNICFCCPVVQGYGLTETCGGGTLADAHDLSTGTVGPPLTCCEILLEEWKEAGYSPNNEKPQGEILIGGKNVALGYFKNDEKTKNRELITAITDRKKDLLKLAHGEYISLGKVETNILTNHGVETVCAYGDSSKDYLVALVVPERKYLKKLAEELNVGSEDMEELCKDKKVVEAVLKEIQSHVSGKLQRVEIPKKILLCPEPWTPASGLVTEALKLKRKAIEKAFKEDIEKLYS
ncbi:AMP-binding enzyme [Ancylostoma duodenale]|uniref:long-chain-fatty-acid--CoA ligase n=1 Tax=Ancylostoma duodenale TaxID=51022 RepID=A0A0C2HCI2_9BILA|nr:AMP-binding enzyme [Ancylostoma duodenale]